MMFLFHLQFLDSPLELFSRGKALHHLSLKHLMLDSLVACGKTRMVRKINYAFDGNGQL